MTLAGSSTFAVVPSDSGDTGSDSARKPSSVSPGNVRQDEFRGDVTARDTTHESELFMGPDELFEKLFEQSPDAVVVADATGRIVQVNAQAVQSFGYSLSELSQQPVEILIPQRFRPSHPGFRESYMQHPHRRAMGAGLSLFGLRKDGSEFPADIMLTPVETSGRQFILVVIRDITERLRLQKSLRDVEGRLRLFVENVRDYAILQLDSNGLVKSWNVGAERMKGYAANEIIGKHFSCFYTQEDLDRGRPEELLRQAREHGRAEDEGWRVRKDGSRFWANVVITCIRDAANQSEGYVKIVRDFTGRKRAEEALLLGLTQEMLSSLDVWKLLAAISSGIGAIVENDLAGLALQDAPSGDLRLQILNPAPPADSPATEVLLPLEGTAAGWVFRHNQPLILNDFEATKFSPSSYEPLVSQGIKAACFFPLANERRNLGLLIVGRRQACAWQEQDVSMLAQVAAQVSVALDNALAFQQISNLTQKLQQERSYLEEELRTVYSFEEIIGESSGLKRVLAQVENVAATDATVLILGETGTGKELIARAIHNLSSRREQTFVKLNCSAIPAGLLESELFGHEKGAFTGAIAQKIGRLELAHQGTLFLDEIGDLPLDLQPKILRALQEREFERLGGGKTIPVDFRLVAATNRDLAQMVADRQFRADLYYRLRVFPIEVPPLRARKADISLLVKYFVHKHALRMNRHIESIPPEVMRALVDWSWPGNVRELENFIERAVILTKGPVLRVPLAELELAESHVETADSNLERTERDHILRILREANGQIGGKDGAAQRLGLKRTTLNSKIKKLGIKRKDYI
ncbi:MAG TPA: sigma 54-interacting transcriptional regulator [Candidatus Acidoferrum sp.]|nr:sigma 54-interacting transcriptional regulator [Candidatus Acidoferrum sp.]